MTDPTTGGPIPGPQQPSTDPASEPSTPQPPAPWPTMPPVGEQPTPYVSQPYGQVPAQPPAEQLPRYGEIASSADRPPAYAAATPPPYPEAQAPAPPAKRPTTVTVAFVSWVVACVVMVISTVMLAATSYYGDLMNQYLGATSQFSQAELETLSTTAKSLSIAVVAVMAVVGIVFAIFILFGRNWARIVLTIFGGLRVVGGLSSIGMFAVGGDVVAAVSLDLLCSLLFLLAVILLWLRASTTFFMQRRAKRR